jgi:hypothetical protein
MAERPGTPLILKRANASRSSGEWRDDDYYVLENGVVVGRIFKVLVAPQNRPCMWASAHNGDIKRAAHGYEPTREAAMAAFAKSWRRSQGFTLLGRAAAPYASRRDFCVWRSSEDDRSLNRRAKSLALASPSSRASSSSASSGTATVILIVSSGLLPNATRTVTVRFRRPDR